jgi:hypothetical protein
MQAQTGPLARDIRLDAISMNEWRVCDRRFDENDHRAVLGVIERRGSDYQATRVSEPSAYVCFGSLSSATHSFAIDDVAD